MRNLLAFLAAVCLTVAIAGWYLNWYHISTAPSDNGHKKLNIDFDTAKMTADTQKGVQNGAAWLSNLVESNKQTTPVKTEDEKKTEEAKPAPAASTPTSVKAKG